MGGSEEAGASPGLSVVERKFIRFLLTGPAESGDDPEALPERADELRALWRRFVELRRGGSLPGAPPPRSRDEELVGGLSLWTAEPGSCRPVEGREVAAGSRYRPIDSRAASRAWVEAWDDDLDRPIALRLPAAGAPPDAVLREAMLTSRLEHPGMPPVHESALDAEGRPFFAMRRPRGRSLKEVFALARRGRDGWSVERALDALRKVCETVAFAHAKGVTHGGPVSERVVVGDFGEVQILGWGRAGSEHPLDPGSLQPNDYPDLDLEPCIPAAEPGDEPQSEPATHDPREDVAALGAMLRELLGGARRGAPPELTAICEKAASPAPEERYPSAGELAADLRAYAEGRVVRAHGAGALFALRKWIGRHRSAATIVALTLAAAAAMLVVTVGTLIEYQRERGQLEDLQLLHNLCEQVERLWGEEGMLLESWSDWHEQARKLAEERLPHYRARLYGMRRGLERTEPDPAWTPPGAGNRAASHRGLYAQEEALRRRLGREDGWEAAGFEETGLPNLQAKFPRLAEDNELGRIWFRRQAGLLAAGEVLRRRHASLEELVDALDAFAREEPARNHEAATAPRGVLADAEREVEYLRWLQSGFALEWGAIWEEAIESIADQGDCPRYDGLRIRLQPGLGPLGRDPRTGLWEFADLRTGELPRWRPGEDPIAREEDALVLVLIPGSAELEPFLLSKYEMTQGQWGRFALQRSYFSPEGRYWGDLGLSRLHPAEHMSWESATWLVHHLRLDLPTVAQWEHAARGGSESGALIAGDDSHSEHKEIPCAERAPGTWFPHLRHHRPVGRGDPNGYGLYDLSGNVSEWCQGPVQADGKRPVRGGSYRSAQRGVQPPSGQALKSSSIGLRPSRRLVP